MTAKTDPPKLTLQPKVEVPFVTLEILCYSSFKTGSKQRIMDCLKILQSRIDSLGSKSVSVRILYYIDDNELSVEEKKKWLLDNTKSYYHCFFDIDNEDASLLDLKAKAAAVKKLITIVKSLKENNLS